MDQLGCKVANTQKNDGSTVADLEGGGGQSPPHDLKFRKKKLFQIFVFSFVMYQFSLKGNGFA